MHAGCGLQYKEVTALAEQHVNVIILKSIAINKEMKRFFLNKFKKMVKNNGQAYACDKMKILRETLLGYRADPYRIARADAWLRRSGFKVNGWLRKLFHYMDTQPELALQFVKLYCGPNEPIITVAQSAESQHRVLAEARKVTSKTPDFLGQWLHHIVRERKLTINEYAYLVDIARYHPEAVPTFLRKCLLTQPYGAYSEYVSKWKRVLFVGPIDHEELRKRLASFTPRAEMYCDVGTGHPVVLREAPSFDEDVANFISMAGYLDLPADWGGNGLTTDDYSYLFGLLPDDSKEFLSDYEASLPCMNRTPNFFEGTFVGQIHHIPKKGTVKRRAIAPPNRFVQLGTVPVDLQLEQTLRKIGQVRDCTFNQTRLNRYIANRVNNDTLYAGSVDLHQATDFLPFEWMNSIWNFLYSGRVESMVESSWRLFCHMANGAWWNEGYRDTWSTGQPLGALPSFKCLAITHNLFLEALCFSRGILHSPYAILGDDLVIMNKKCRQAYIAIMTRHGVPLSLNKSYESRLVEFAGQVFIKNLNPFYNTDQRALTWNSLYDYQWATGIHIPYSHLPRKLQRKIVRLAIEAGLSRDEAGDAYEVADLYGCPARGSNVLWTGSDQWLDFLPALASELDADTETSPDVEHVSGITFLRGGHPVCFADRAYAEKDGYFLQYRRMEPEWFRSKFRPVATDKIIAAAARAVKLHRDAATKT
jgi:hypothetical protein